MKPSSIRSLRRLLLKIAYFANYTDQIYEMEKVLARRPEKLQIDIVGSGEISPDAALLMRSILLKRSAQTHLITNARSSLQGGAVLVWLLGDTRLIREDAKLYFRHAIDQDENEDKEGWKDEESKTSDVDLEEVDYAQVLQHIDEFLPVKELAGRAIDLQVLKQFGLVENQKVDLLLASAFARREDADEPRPPPEPDRSRTQQLPKAPRSE